MSGAGELHAERNAIASLTESAEGATLYVTLEPCCHYGKTPPCTEAILEQKIARVVIGSRDPKSPGIRKRSGDPKSSGSPGGRGLYAGGMRCVKSGVLPLYHKENALCGHEIRHDSGRKDRCADRRFQVDHRRKRKEKRCRSCATSIWGSWRGSARSWQMIRC